MTSEDNPEKEKILVLCVDRDNDIGKKAGLETPIIGRDSNLDAAQSLGVSDPTESDVNAIYKAVKIYDELNADKDVEIVTIAGDSQSKIKADEKISRELEKVQKELGVNKAVLVTDGMEDDRVLPVIESNIKIMSVNQAIVKQSKQLESSYFMIKDFFRDVSENEETSRVLFGIPAIALVIYALFGVAGWRLILGAVGAYLFVKGFSLEESVTGAYSELRTSLTSRRTSFFLYILAFIILLVGFGRSYNFIQFNGYETIFNQSVAFIYSSIYFMYASGFLIGLGKLIKSPKREYSLLFLLYIGIGFAISLIVNRAFAYLILVETEIMVLVYTAIASSIITGITLFVERKLR